MAANLNAVENYFQNHVLLKSYIFVLLEFFWVLCRFKWKINKKSNRKLQNVIISTHHARQSRHAWRSSFSRATRKSNKPSFALENKTTFKYNNTNVESLQVESKLKVSIDGNYQSR